MKSVLVTGASGFLGGYVIREMQRSGWSVIATGSGSAENSRVPAGVRYESLLLPDTRLRHLVREVRPDACIHCAGRASVMDSMRDPAADFRAGVVLTAELLDVLREEAPGCSVVYLSSAAVYGEPDALPITEDSDTHPLSPYGFHKRMGELLMEEAARVYGLRTCSVRIFSAYGPGLRRQILWEICSQYLAKGTVRLQGTGKESRDFIHAADVARAVRMLVESADGRGEVYNLASGEEVTIADLVREIGTHFPKAPAAEFAGVQRAGDPQNWQADVSRIQSLGFRPEVGLSTGLAGVVAWARALLG
jgi:UDP-glucose 4-epimerase